MGFYKISITKAKCENDSGIKTDIVKALGRCYPGSYYTSFRPKTAHQESHDSGYLNEEEQ
ncbi:hypothetical protein OUZ56_008043 [Daphnia magna]|uniref:Uncharacterized protein n=1 Tax=Daphnia magna TaxID=35525 RepID=A0ABR0AC25_9CRUS|nr:hypothetical protein OUZ56_008043 [Daphnia magna]